ILDPEGLAPPAASSASLLAAAAGDATPTDASARRALIVDDDARSLAAGAALLIHCGCTVQTASHAEAALNLLAVHRFDVVVMDGQMPDLDGIEATRRIRACAPGYLNEGIPILGFTADPSPVRVRDWLAAGANAVLAKPSAIAEFSASLDRVAPIHFQAD
ncbi:MAG: response regulator, partial [Burkholderiales bacterium]|nr:response regulator [Opitutaceae bacterium]